MPHAAPLFSSRATLYPRLATMPTWCHAAVERDLRLEVSCPLVQRRLFRFPVNLIGALSFVEFLQSNPTGLQQLGCCFISDTTFEKTTRDERHAFSFSSSVCEKVPMRQCLGAVVRVFSCLLLFFVFGQLLGATERPLGPTPRRRGQFKRQLASLSKYGLRRPPDGKIFVRFLRMLCSW